MQLLCKATYDRTMEEIKKKNYIVDHKPFPKHTFKGVFYTYWLFICFHLPQPFAHIRSIFVMLQNNKISNLLVIELDLHMFRCSAQGYSLLLPRGSSTTNDPHDMD